MKQAHANIDEALATLRDMAHPGSEVLEHERQAIKMVLAEIDILRRDQARLDKIERGGLTVEHRAGLTLARADIMWSVRYGSTQLAVGGKLRSVIDEATREGR